MSPECFPCDAEQRAVSGDVGSELESEPAAGLPFHGLQCLEASLVIAVGGVGLVAAGWQMLLALEKLAAVQFVAVRC